MASPRLRSLVTGMWVFAFLFVVAYHVFAFYVPTAANFRFTFTQDCAAPGTLVSDRWNFRFFYTGLYVFLTLVFFTFAFMIAQWKIGFPRWLHIAVAALVLIWLLVLLFAFFIPYWVTANRSTEPPTANPASDPRWCCAYFAEPAADGVCCNAPATPCTPNVTPSDLTVSGDFLFEFFFVAGFVVLLIIDLLLSSAFTSYVGIELNKAEDQQLVGRKMTRRDRVKRMK